MKSIGIVGSGWYGCYIAEYLLENFNDIEITIIEKESDIFSGSSSFSQNRLHLGFHYPRCDITSEKCKKNFPKFLEKYNDCISHISKNYYAISNTSKVPYEDYISKYKDYKIIKNDFLSNIDGDILSVNEKLIDQNKSKNHFISSLKNRVKFKFNCNVKSIKQSKDSVILNDELIFDKVFNATYNQVQSTTYVSYEKCLSLLYKKKSDTPFDCLTIMDGGYSSIYEYSDDIYTLTDVIETPVSRGSLDKVINSDFNLKKKINLFEENISYYYPDFKNNFEYYDHFESLKCKNISTNDSRDINLEIDSNILNVWCGKISFVCETNEHIETFIG